MTIFTPSRDAALAQAQAFAPMMGKRYANGRNYDHGRDGHKAVSQLSPYLRRRLITEQEVVTMAIEAHGAEKSEKFVQEVVWRSYFKGWLERRPQVWHSYQRGLEQDLADLAKDRRMARDVARLTEARSGIDYMDGWAQELIETGYLHNHARMWFASIWIFSLGLPWRVGADFFYRHLLDGDAASNTLGWRWVAGLHTRGKAYPARADNIATFTGGRFQPRAQDLADVGDGLVAQEPDGLPDLRPLRAFTAPDPAQPSLLLITDEDCSLQDFPLDLFNWRGAVTLATSHLRSPLAVADHVTGFEAAALTDTAKRVGMAAPMMTAGDPRDLLDWAERQGATQIVTPYVTQGPVRDWLDRALPDLARQGVSLAEWRRDWDAAIWPAATAGFFKVKQQIPRLLDDLVAV
jgi:deoxyribodipyrimidine photo-lyase